MTSKILEFLGGMSLTRFSDFYASNKEGVVVVIACCLGVDEGVDMWFPEECNCFDPRFRLKITVGNNVDEATFVLCDDAVRRVAHFTCDLLMSLEEGSSLYPNEIDDLFGDPLLFKVNKKFSGGEGSAMVYEVLEMFDDPSLINVYVNPFHSVYGPLGVEMVDPADVEHYRKGDVGSVRSLANGPLNSGEANIGLGVSKKGAVAGCSIYQDAEVTVSEGVLAEAVRGCDVGRPFDEGLVKGVKRRLFDSIASVDPNEKIFRVKL